MKNTFLMQIGEVKTKNAKLLLIAGFVFFFSYTFTVNRGSA